MTNDPLCARFIINGALPSLNDIMGGGKFRFGGDMRKKQAVNHVRWCIKAEKLPKFKTPVSIQVNWVERDYRRDPDNIMSGGLKVILDALVHEEILPNDGRRWIKKLSNYFSEPCKATPHILVEIEEWR